MLAAALFCLTMNVYFEARFEPERGQAMVVITTLNRAGWDGARVCNEVFEPYQFSWTNDPTQIQIHSHGDWRRIYHVVTLVTQQSKDQLRPIFGDLVDATHYHADYVLPTWADSMRYLGQIGHHKFYEEK